MARFVLFRLLTFLPTLFVIVTLTFFLVRLAPGGPFSAEKALSDEALRQIEAHYNLDAPLLEQYGSYLWRLLHGDLGPSLKRPSRTVVEWIAIKLPVSVELGFYGLLVALGVGLPAGIVAASRPNTWRDYVPMAFAMAGICVPNFVLGPVLVLIFALYLGWLPVALWEVPSDKILPAVALGTVYAAYIARLSRASMIEVLSQDYIRTARAKGMKEQRVLMRHALPGALQPVVAFLGPAAAGLLTGSFVVENIFGIPGLGTEFVKAALNRDYTMIMGTVLVFAVLIMAFNLVVDVVQAWLDPRLRYG
jgi:oligopeptide transport system permease protein